MLVNVIASTAFDGAPMSVWGTSFDRRLMADTDEGGPDSLAEFAGRACYQAWGLKNPKTAHNEGYLANIIRQGHFSVLEHGSVTFYIEGVSRSLTHELIRHRHLSFSELSQRYVDIEEVETVAPPALEDEEIEHLHDVTSMARQAYEVIVEALTDRGTKRKQAREAARSVMPNATETKIVVTGNLRAWRDVLYKRHHVAADAEIQELAREILAHLRDIAPHSVQDIPDAPFN